MTKAEQWNGQQAKIEAFRERLEQDQRTEQARRYPDGRLEPPCAVVSYGKVWARVDVRSPGGLSGKYMVATDGEIFGIKGYGVPHRGHRYGTTDTIDAWNWGGYTASRKL
jgi:hypothetical protein